jgi:hypothetical protein
VWADACCPIDVVMACDGAERTNERITGANGATQARQRKHSDLRWGWLLVERRVDRSGALPAAVCQGRKRSVEMKFEGDSACDDQTGVTAQTTNQEAHGHERR